MTSPFPSRRPVETPPARSGYNCRRARISKVLLMAPCSSHFHRRGFLAAAGAAGLSWLTPLGTPAGARRREGATPAKSVIVLWMGGGPSQLETFDPKPGTNIAGGTQAIDTAAKGVQLATGSRAARRSDAHVALVRSLWSKEGDHERGTYTLKTGFRPDPTVIASLARRDLSATSCPGDTTEIPRHVSILPNQWPGPRRLPRRTSTTPSRCYDPADKVPDVTPRVSDRALRAAARTTSRWSRGLRAEAAAKRVEATLHRRRWTRARKMMSSEQLKAFDVSREPERCGKEYGDTPFGRGCLAARRLTRSRRALRRGHARRLGQPRQQPRDLQASEGACSTRRSRRSSATSRRATLLEGHGRALRRRVRPHAAASTRSAAATTGRTASALRWPAAAFAAGCRRRERPRGRQGSRRTSSRSRTCTRPSSRRWASTGRRPSRPARPHRSAQRRQAHRGAVELMAPWDTGMMPGSARGATRSATRGSPGANYSLPWRLTGSEAQIPHPEGSQTVAGGQA